MASVLLTWKDNSTTEEGQRIYRSLEPMDEFNLPAPLAEIDPDVITYTDETAVPGETYYYRLSAYQGSFEKVSSELMVVAGDAGGGDPHWDNVVALLHFDGVDGSTVFVDSSPSQKTVTPYGNAKISTTHSVFGGSSGSFSGVTNTYLSIPETSIGVSEDFTIEGFMLPLATSTYSYMCGSISTGNLQILRVEHPSGQLITALSPFDVLVADAILAGVWGHFALTRVGGIMRIFYNGVLKSSKPSTTAFAIDSIGAAYNFFGSQYIDEFRITKGVARYTENFTPPTEPFPNFGP